MASPSRQNFNNDGPVAQTASSKLIKLARSKKAWRARSDRPTDRKSKRIIGNVARVNSRIFNDQRDVVRRDERVGSREEWRGGGGGEVGRRVTGKGATYTDRWT